MEEVTLQKNEKITYRVPYRYRKIVFVGCPTEVNETWIVGHPTGIQKYASVE